MKRKRTKLSSRLLAWLIAMTMAACLMPVNMWEAEAVTTLKNPVIRNNGDGTSTTTWDCVYFGSYPQSSDGNGGFKTEPIKWRVLSVDGNDAFLLADQNLDCQPYNKELVGVTWETCTLRSWLNDEFMDTAFTSAERNAIKTTTVVNNDNSEYGTEGGNNTQDKAYLLSIGEATSISYGFESVYHQSETRESKSTRYAQRLGGTVSDEYYDNRIWLLRSPGNNSNNAAFIHINGFIHCNGINVDYRYDNAVRPVLHLNLSSDIWSYAGTVSASFTKLSQYIYVSPRLTKTFGSKPLSLGAKAETKLIYKSNNTKVATVSPDSIVTLKNPGKTTITVMAAETEQYSRATKTVTINCKLKRPTLKAKTSGNKEVKLSWNKVPGATKYEVFMYDAKKKKFVKKITKGSGQRSAIHKGMTKGKTYQYKVRAYRVVDGKKVYSAFSNVKKVKVK